MFADAETQQFSLSIAAAQVAQAAKVVKVSCSTLRVVKF